MIIVSHNHYNSDDSEDMFAMIKFPGMNGILPRNNGEN